MSCAGARACAISRSSSSSWRCDSSAIATGGILNPAIAALSRRPHSRSQRSRAVMLAELRVSHTPTRHERWKGGGVKAKGAKRPAIATRTGRRTAPPSMHQRHSRGAIGTRREPSVPSAQAALSMAGGQGACASNLLPRTCRQGTGRAPCSKDLPRLAGEGPNRRPKQAKNYRELLAGQVAHFT